MIKRNSEPLTSWSTRFHYHHRRNCCYATCNLRWLQVLSLNISFSPIHLDPAAYPNVDINHTPISTNINYINIIQQLSTTNISHYQLIILSQHQYQTLVVQYRLAMVILSYLSTISIGYITISQALSTIILNHSELWLPAISYQLSTSTVTINNHYQPWPS